MNTQASLHVENIKMQKTDHFCMRRNGNVQLDLFSALILDGSWIFFLDCGMLEEMWWQTTLCLGNSLHFLFHLGILNPLSCGAMQMCSWICFLHSSLWFFECLDFHLDCSTLEEMRRWMNKLFFTWTAVCIFSPIFFFLFSFFLSAKNSSSSFLPRLFLSRSPIACALHWIVEHNFCWTIPDKNFNSPFLFLCSFINISKFYSIWCLLTCKPERTWQYVNSSTQCGLCTCCFLCIFLISVRLLPARNNNHCSKLHQHQQNHTISINCNAGLFLACLFGNNKAETVTTCSSTNGFTFLFSKSIAVSLEMTSAFFCFVHAQSNNFPILLHSLVSILMAFTWDVPTTLFLFRITILVVQWTVYATLISAPVGSGDIFSEFKLPQ